MQHARCTWRSLAANSRNAYAAIPKVCLELDRGAHLSGSFVHHQRLIAGRTIARSERGLAGVIAGRRSGRPVPCPPPLTRLLRERLADFAGEPADPLFRGGMADRWPPSHTAAHGTAPAKWRSRTRSTVRRSPAAHTTFAMHACPLGSTGECPQPRSPNGLATASRSCFGSTLNASKANTRSPNAGSPLPLPTSSSSTSGDAHMPM
jgi:hypothetical protein